MLSRIARRLAAVLLAVMIAPAVGQSRPDVGPLPLTVFKNLKAGRTQTVVVYGTSLTAGGEWPNAMKDYFARHFPGRVTFVNAAKNGMHSDWGVENLPARVLAKKPDLVFIEFAINDAATKNDVSPEKSVANLDAMVQAVRRQNPQADVVLQTMNPPWDSPATPQKKYATDRPNVSAYYAAARRYAQDKHLPLIDHEPTWNKLLAETPEQFHAAVPDGIHPSAAASLATTWPAIETVLEAARATAESETRP